MIINRVCRELCIGAVADQASRGIYHPQRSAVHIALVFGDGEGIIAQLEAARQA